MQQALADRYRIERELGAGGMAIVFLARDLRHDREVAVKVLRPELATSIGPARFLQEIKIAARLSHPHILTLIDSGEADGLLYYVMPFVTGETLRAKLAREGRLSVTDAVRYLRDLMDALAFAHGNGLVHRDVKPENVMLDGRHALVMDFGVAKAISEATGVQHQTTAGVSIGTPAYMAPEQVAADSGIDHRADLYAAGIVTYEMLAGHHPFEGMTPQQVMAAHVSRAPRALRELQPSVPEWLDALVMRCLEKDPASRFQRAEDILLQLEPAVPTASHLSAARPTWRRRVPWIIASAAATGAVAVALLLTMRKPANVELSLGRSQVLTGDPGIELYPRISPDGRWVVYSAGNSAGMRLFVRPAVGGRAIALTVDPAEFEADPRWSPDGTQILYRAGSDVRVVPALGGTSRVILRNRVDAAVSSATWRPDGKVVAWSTGDSLFLVPSAGGPSTFLAESKELHSCEWSPGGKWIACVTGDPQFPMPGSLLGNVANSTIVLVLAASGGTVMAASDSTSMNQVPVWGTTDTELYFVSDRDGTRDVYAQGLDASGRGRGAPRRVTVGLNAHSVHFAADGRRMVYSVYTTRANLWSVPIAARGSVSVSAARQVTTGNQTVESMTISRDNAWTLYDSDLSGTSDLYRMRMGGGQPERLTSTPDAEYRPELSPNGRFVAYHSFHAGSRDVFILPLEGGTATQVTATPAQEARPTWSPSGDALAFVDLAPPMRPLIVHRLPDGRWSAPVARDTAVPVLRSSCVPAPDWSPDGRLFAYCAGQSIRVVAPDTGAPREVYTSDTTASRPLIDWVMWGRSGPMIYFRGMTRGGATGIWSIDAAGGTPRLVLRFDDPAHPSPRAEFAVSRTQIYFTISDRQSDVWIADVVRRD